MVSTSSMKTTQGLSLRAREKIALMVSSKQRDKDFHILLALPDIHVVDLATLDFQNSGSAFFGDGLG